MNGGRVLLVLAAAAATSAIGLPARADDTDEATRLYAEGSALASRHRCAEALAPLERSDALLPSPNTTLLVARCLEELGRDEEAAERFQRAMVDAQARAEMGEAKYARTAATARVEGTAVRVRLGTLRVRTSPASARAVVETDRGGRTVGEDGALELLHKPGEVTVTVHAAGHLPTTRTASIVAGRYTTVEVALAEAPEAPVASPIAPLAPPPTPEQRAPPKRSWQRPLGYALAGLGVAGGAVFTGFGLDAKDRYEALDACAPRCGPTERAGADIGERSQTIANVGLIAGALALIAGIVLVVTAR